jgi:hypothetical protein
MQIFLRLFKPLVRMMLRQNIAAGEAIQGLKQSYIDAAEDQLANDGEKMTNAKIAVLTGLDRNEVSRIRRGVDRSGNSVGDEIPLLHLNRAARVVTNWPKENGQPVDLPYTGDNSFFDLVKQHSGGIPAHSLLEELERNGAACKLVNGDIHLLDDIFIPASASKKLEISSEQISRLLATVDNNIAQKIEEKPFLQLELVFKDLSDEVIESFRILSKEEMASLLQKIAVTIQEQHEQSIASTKTTSATPKTRKSGLGVYFFDIYEE